MLIFFLDDQDERHALVEQVLSKNEHRVLHAFDILEGIEIINKCQERIGLAMLDHDLGCVDYYGDGKTPITGEMFVNSMIKGVSKDKWPAQVIIHSYNDAGSRVMRSILEKNDIFAVHWPFSKDMVENVKRQIREQ